MGTCLPLCSFQANGNAPAGCVGKDVCNVLGYDGTQAPPVGLGFCLGGCTQDGDCVAGEKCDLTTAYCVKTVTPPTKALGAACTSAEAAMNPPPCNCLYDTTSGAGFCTEACTVGGTQCQAGWFCDAEEPTTLTGANDASVTGFTTQNTGLGGFCVPTCTVGVTTCPTNSTCKTTFAGGPGCIP
jgi:hypothetical protein